MSEACASFQASSTYCVGKAVVRRGTNTSGGEEVLGPGRTCFVGWDRAEVRHEGAGARFAAIAAIAKALPGFGGAPLRNRLDMEVWLTVLENRCHAIDVRAGRRSGHTGGRESARLTFGIVYLAGQTEQDITVCPHVQLIEPGAKPSLHLFLGDGLTLDKLLRSIGELAYAHDRGLALGEEILAHLRDLFDRVDDAPRPECFHHTAVGFNRLDLTPCGARELLGEGLDEPAATSRVRNGIEV